MMVRSQHKSLVPDQQGRIQSLFSVSDRQECLSHCGFQWNRHFCLFFLRVKIHDESALGPCSARIRRAVTLLDQLNESPYRSDKE